MGELISNNNQELIKIKLNKEQEPIVSGRTLHNFLEIQTPYKKWFDRMIEYGFTENVDFVTVGQKCPIANGGYQEIVDHAIKLDMAKELSMIQRNEKGKQARKYFIQIQNDWNSPEKVMARALILANKIIQSLTVKNAKQIIDNQKNATIKTSYYDLVSQCKDLVPISIIAKDYGLSAQKLNNILRDKKIHRKQGNVWVLYKEYIRKGYVRVKTPTLLITYWTQKGRLFIYELLKKDNILPLIEQEQ